MESWQKYLPEYRVKRWDEENFDVNSVAYVKKAYESKKFAFVADYVRLHALLHYGGIYLDTDTEIIRSLDDFLKYPAFLGFESYNYVSAGIIGSEPDGMWVKEQLESYRNRHFIMADGKQDLTTIVQTFSRIMSGNGLLLNNTYQVYKEEMHVFPKDYFSPKSNTGVTNLTQNSVCIHHYASSWEPLRLKFKRFFFQKILGPKLTDMLVKIKHKIIHNQHAGEND